MNEKHDTGVEVPSAAPPSLCERLQQKCSDWGAYWRAPDAHGVVLTQEQALELLRDALGVEVEFKDTPTGVEASDGEGFCDQTPMPGKGPR